MIVATCHVCKRVVELRPCGLDGAVLLPKGWLFRRDGNGTWLLYCESEACR